MKRIGRYEILEELGRGAMGMVYKASDPTIGRQVALKVLSLETAPGQGGPGAKETFMREARAAGRLTHPAIVTIHDAFEDPQSKLSCIVMELVAGRTLEKILLSETPLSLQQTLDIARQVAEGLEYAHQQQVIHRDLKPANILLTQDRRVKITDFGIAKVTAREGAVRTVGVMGTPSYMSPEQVTGGAVDTRSDLFSLGIILYQALTGQKPFTGDTAAVMFKIVYEDPVFPSTVNPQLTPAHDYVVLRCLAKDRNKRYGTAREFLDDLDDIQQGRPPRSQAKFPLTELRAGEPTLTMQPPIIPAPRPTPAGARSMAKWIAVTAAVLMLGGALGLGLWKIRRPKTSPPAPPVATASQPSIAPQQGAAPAASPPASQPGTSKAASRSVAPSEPETSRSREEKKLGSATAAVSPVEEVKPESAPSTSAEPRAVKPQPAGRVVQLHCRHDLKEGQLTISSGGQVIYRTTLRGRKRGGFLGIKGAYVGIFMRTITLPVAAQQFSVRVVAADGSIDLSKSIEVMPPAGHSVTLLVDIAADQLAVNWHSAPRAEP